MYSMDESSSSDSKYSYSSTSESESSDASSGSDSEYSYYSSTESESDSESEDEFYSCDEVVIVMDEVPESTKDLMVFPKMQSKEQRKKYKKYFLSLSSELRSIVLSLKESYKRNEDRDDQEHVVILFGSPSAGKSEGCKAIAYALNWPYIYLSSSSLGTTYQNSAVQNMKDILLPLIKDGNPYVVIFDEITALTKGAQESHEEGVRAHQDTEQYKNACELNTLLDKIRESKSMLFLGTTNNVELLTEPIQERSKLIHYESTPAMRWKKFKDELAGKKLELDEEAQTYLASVKERVSNLSFRNIESLVKCLKRMSRERHGYGDVRLTVQANDITIALAEIEQEIEIVKKANDKKSEARIMHDETIAVQKDLHNKNLEFQVGMEKAKRLHEAQRSANPGWTDLATLLKAT